MWGEARTRDSNFPRKLREWGTRTGGGAESLGCPSPNFWREEPGPGGEALETELRSRAFPHPRLAQRKGGDPTDRSLTPWTRCTLEKRVW